MFICSTGFWTYSPTLQIDLDGLRAPHLILTAAQVRSGLADLWGYRYLGGAENMHPAQKYEY